MNTNHSNQSEEFEILADVCDAVSLELSTERRTLTERVVSRSETMGRFLGLDEVSVGRLRAAAGIHRLGELYLDDQLSAKSYLQMSEKEIGAYRSYPIFTALRVCESVTPEVYTLLLNHREYCSGNGFLSTSKDQSLSIGARILCVATEYEELMMFYGTDVVKQDVIQRRILKNAIGRYEQRAIEALMDSIAQEHGVH